MVYHGVCCMYFLDVCWISTVFLGTVPCVDI